MIKKNICLFLILVAVRGSAQIQDTTVEYFDDEWMEVKAPKKAMYYRKAFERNDTVFVSDFFISGILQMRGTYKDKGCKIKNGLFSYYTEEGVKASEGQFNNGLREGKWSYWTKHGVLSETSVFLHDTLNGEDYTYYPSGKAWALRVYKMGVKQNTSVWNEDGLLLETKNHVNTNSFVESMPEFPGGQEAMGAFFNKELKYPKRAREKGIEGRVVLQFIVNIDGSISDVIVVKAVEKSIDEEAVRIIKLMPKWKPGSQNYKYVTVKMTLPIVFKLN